MKKELKEKLRQDPIRWEHYKQKRREHKKRQLERLKNDPIRYANWKEKQEIKRKKKQQEKLIRRNQSSYYQSPVGWKRCKYHNFRVLATNANRRCKNGKITATEIWSIVKKQKCLCPITGERLTSDNISIDHIVPISKGGTNCKSNIQIVTKRANVIKNNMDTNELVRFCQAVIDRLSP